MNRSTNLLTLPFRRLRVYAFDPSLDIQLDVAFINQLTLKISGELLRPGPVGEYLEVIDYDPASACMYEPVDLTMPHLLMQDGLTPSLGNPQFHQQMVYAVAMTTIRNFERALGRVALWRSRDDLKDNSGHYLAPKFVQRLRIYPHAMREANAYYSPNKIALLFGYFPANESDSGLMLPGGMVFTCLSHDIVAHETTHALLDGMHRVYSEATNVDTLAFHEAFADIVALFQHFSFPEVLKHQIAKTRGDLASQNILGQLAQEFGHAIGQYGALRDALGNIDPDTGLWRPLIPDPTMLSRTFEPHARGALLVAAVFNAFLLIYKKRSADLMRIATSGSGIFPYGELHPDLVNRLASEAAKSAQHILNMCIRALDYCPPIDLTFGDYLRALITADYDLVRDDERGYRIAVLEAFKRHGIFPADVRGFSEDTIRWQPATPETQELLQVVLPPEFLKELGRTVQGWDLHSQREEVFQETLNCKKMFHKMLSRSSDKLPNFHESINEVLGLDLFKPDKRFSIHSLRPARRTGPDGEYIVDLIVEIIQSRPGYLSSASTPDLKDADFLLSGGCTLLVDMETGLVRYCITKDVQSEGRLERQRRFMLARTDRPISLKSIYFGRNKSGNTEEPFAILHRSGNSDKL